MSFIAVVYFQVLLYRQAAKKPLSFFEESRLIEGRLATLLIGRERVPITILGFLWPNVAEAERSEPHFPCAKHARCS